MSSDEYQVQNVYRYARKTYKKNLRKDAGQDNGGFSPNEDNVGSDRSRRSDRVVDMPNCSCDEREGDVASILHKKCPVITLARQQLQRLLEDTDQVLCDNTRCCRSMYDFLLICREILLNQKCLCSLFLFIAVAFFVGLLLGAASCGSYLGNFNSPLLTCLDNLFLPDTHGSIDQYRGIV